uniref:Large ribosomal subunit protein uL10m n=1 Tax=Hucho hucho TaxID=62062 RepID=A0A4W5JB45_9TELE
MHILKQKLMTVTEYIPPKPAAPLGILTPHVKQVQEESGLVLLLKKELQTMFQDCKMIAVIQNNATNSEDILLLKHRQIVYKTVLLDFSEDTIIQTLPSRQGVLNYAKLSSVTLVQGELVSGLTMLTSQTASMLQRHPAHLSLLLQQKPQSKCTNLLG